VLDSADSKTGGFFHEIMCVFNSAICLFGKNRVYLHFENLTCRKYSFHKLPEFSQVNNVLDAPASNTYGFH
jgi:hypothetical protein